MPPQPPFGILAHAVDQQHQAIIDIFLSADNFPGCARKRR